MILSLLALSACMPLIEEPAEMVCVPRDPVEALRQADSSDLVEVSKRVRKALEKGCYYGKEADIAKALAPVWRTCPRDPELSMEVSSIFHVIFWALMLEDGDLAREVLMETPMACLEKRPQDWNVWFPYLKIIASPELARESEDVLSRLVVLAGDDPDRLSELLKLSYNFQFYAELPNLTSDQIDALIENSGPDVRGLPEIFSKISGESGTEALLRLAEKEDVDSRVRENALRKLEGRELKSKELLRVLDLLMSEEGWISAEALKILIKKAKSFRLIKLPEDIQDGLVFKMRTLKEGCKMASILATQERPGAERLYAYWIKTREGRAVGCYELTEALKDVSPLIKDELVRAYEKSEDPMLFPFLLSAGEVGLVEAALKSPNAEVRREAMRHLVDYFVEHPKDVRVKRALRRVALEDLSVEAWKALLEAGDSVVTWDSLLKIVEGGGLKEQNVYDMLLALNLPAPQFFLNALLNMASEPRDREERIRALHVARRTAELAMLEGIYALEPTLRSLLDDADEGVKRAAISWFTVVPAKEVATTKKLLDLKATYALIKAETVPSGAFKRISPESEAYAHILRKDPEALNELAAVVLHRSGDSRMRKLLFKEGDLEVAKARSLLKRLDGEPLNSWLPKRNFSLEDILRAEEDPPPWSLLKALIPDTLLNAWLVEKAENPKLPWDMKLHIMYLVTGKMSKPTRGRLMHLWVEAIRSGKVSPTLFLDGFLRQFGYYGIKALVDTFWDDPEELEALESIWIRAKILSDIRSFQGLGGGGIPSPKEEDIPWIAKHVKELAEKRDSRRLKLFLTVANIYSLGQSFELARAAYDMGITPALLKHIDDPKWCKAAHPLNFLLGRQFPQKCKSR